MFWDKSDLYPTWGLNDGLDKKMFRDKSIYPTWGLNDGLDEEKCPEINLYTLPEAKMTVNGEKILIYTLPGV